MIAACNLCSDDDKFKVPWDQIGAQLMKDHITEKHPEGLKDLKERGNLVRRHDEENA